jgi:hypothetical protein
MTIYKDEAMARLLTSIALLIAAAFAVFAAPGSEIELASETESVPAPGQYLDELAARDEAIPASSDFPGLVGSERKLGFEVGKYRAPDGKRWIRLFAEYDSAYRARMDDVIAALWDFESSPKTFSRIISTRVRSDDGSVAVIEQRTGIRILGLGYLSNLVFKDVLKRDGAGSATLDFEAIEVDRTTLSSRGSWIIMESRDESGPLTYVRYTMESYVEPKYPAQEWIMRKFGDGDVRRVIRELNKATLEKAKGG